MNICIESHLLNHPIRSGLMTYTEGLVYGLHDVDQNNQYHLLYYSMKRRPEDMPGPNNVGNFSKSVLRVPDRAFIGRKTLLNQWSLPKYLKKNKINIFHRPSGYAMPNVKDVFKILTVHDLRTLTIGDEYSSQNIEHYKKTLTNIDLCVVVSECTKKDLMEHFDMDEKKIKVTYLGTDKRFRILETSEVNQVKSKFNITRPYFLSVGSVPRKNIPGILKGFAGSKRKKDYQLVLNTYMEVEDYKKQCEALGIMEQVVFVNNVSDEEMVALFNGCDCFLFPSLYEGFGLPIIEAMKCGAPVITSNVSACPEVAGDAALLVDPNNTQEISDAIDQIGQDENLRKVLIEKGFERSKLFSWDKFAKQMKEIYESVQVN